MTTLAVALAALFLAPPAAHAAPADSAEAVGRAPAVAPAGDDPIAWARRVVALRAVVEAAETEPDPARAAALATVALADAEVLAAEAASVRPLLLRAQAAYEAAHGPVAARPLSAAELAELRGSLLASLGDSYRVAPAAPASAAEVAEADRAAGSLALFYPAEAARYVDAQRDAAAGIAPAARRNAALLRRIEDRLRRRGLPPELKYVALIESSLNPRARSHAGAAGLWQFMPATARAQGLTSATVHQEGPSTEAAARYLTWLAGQLNGDWHLALAAYNCGIGRVKRIVRTARAELGREPTFWDIRGDLPRETRHYVPRFLAVAEALS